MRRYFYEGGPLLKKWLQNQSNLTRKEDSIFRSAILSAIMIAQRNNQQYQLPNLHETILQMTIQQQTKYANNFHLEQLFNHFLALHRNTHGKNMLMRGQYSEIKDIVDPDKFPIWDLKKKINLLYPKWGSIMGKIRYDIGFQMFMDESQVEHSAGGKGVFIRLSKNRDKIQTGQLIGFAPGHIYETYENYQKVKLKKLKSYQKTPQHLHFPSGKVLQFSHLRLINYDENSQEIDPTYCNPYAYGQMINHPPIGRTPNVCFSEVQIPINFFPSYFSKYLPYNNYLLRNDKYHTMFGIFALKQIKDGDELYVNYLQNHIYPIDSIPEWLIEPQTEHSYFQKQEYELLPSYYWSYLDRIALKKKQKMYEQYKEKIKRRPGNTVYQDDKVKIRTAKTQYFD